MSSAVSAIEMRQITRRFPGVIANDQVDFSARWGEVHALVGENGAGKTTLMNVLYGLHPPDSGEILLYGKRAEIGNPRDAIARGIGMVHQHFMLVQAFTALENVILGAEPVTLGRTDYRLAQDRVQRICDRFQLQVNLSAKVADLSVSAQQKVEILKALYRDARILILDEPTSVLAPQEAENLFMMLRRMASEGMCVILISHKLRDVMTYTDRVTVLRRGKSVAVLETAATSPQELSRLMVGEIPEAEVERKAAEVGQPILEVTNLTIVTDSGIKALDAVSFELRSGEILGIAGVDGNGQREIAEAIAGLQQSSGGVILDGREIRGLSVRERIEAGIAYVSEDRQYSLILDYSIRDNAILGAHRELAKFGFISRASAGSHAAGLVADFDVRAVGTDAAAGSLSGGNLQKLVLGRALSRRPRLLIATQPTRGLDVSAAAEIHRHLLNECSRGAGILLVSHDLDEILSLSDRILVMFRGRVAGVLSREEADAEKIGHLMLGAGL